MVLVLLELCWDIGGQIASLFESKVLCFEIATEVMGHDFTLTAIVLGIANVVTGKIMEGLAVAKEDWSCSGHWLSLPLKTVIGIRGIDNPLADILLLCVHACLLLATDGRVVLWSMWRAAEVKRLLKDVWVRLDDDLLAEANDIIGAKHVELLGLLDGEERSCDGTWGLLRGRDHVCLFNLLESVVDVHHQPSFSGLVSQHEAVSISNAAILAVSPWDFLVILLVRSQCLAER